MTTDRQTERELKAIRLMDPETDALLLSTILAGFRQALYFNIRHYKLLSMLSAAEINTHLETKRAGSNLHLSRTN